MGARFARPAVAYEECPGGAPIDSDAIQRVEMLFKTADSVSIEELFVEACERLVKGPNEYRLYVGHLDQSQRSKLYDAFINVGVEVELGTITFVMHRHRS